MARRTEVQSRPANEEPGRIWEPIGRPEPREEAAAPASAALVNHSAHNYIIINKINDVCRLRETFERPRVDHGAERRRRRLA